MTREMRNVISPPTMIAPMREARCRCLAFMFDHGFAGVPSMYASAFV